MRFRFDTISFLIGFAIATLFWWLVSLMRPLFIRLIEIIKNKQKEDSQKRISGLEGAYLKSLYKQTQGMHIASSLFSLDEIIVTPRLLSPPVVFEPGTPHHHLDIVELAVPYLPDYPELGSAYNAPTLSLSQALSGGTNIAIIGQPGTGKTTALAHLASEIAQAHSNNTYSAFTPFFIHVTDLGLPLKNPQNPRDFLTPIIEKISQSMGLFDSRKIPNFVEHIFLNSHALLLLDGLDELPQSAVQEVNAYLRVILRQYPNTRVILTGAPEYLDGILSLGFTPLSIMPWNNDQQAAYLENWANLWQKHVVSEEWVPHSETSLDPTLLASWLSSDNFGLTPLEYTLKIWGGFAGDIISGRSIDVIEAFIRRILPADISAEAVSTLAYQAVLNEVPIFDERTFKEWIKSFEPPSQSKKTTEETFIETPAAFEYENAKDAGVQVTSKLDKTTESRATSSAQLPISKSGNILSLVSSGLLITHAGNKFSFAHPVIQGYLAGKHQQSTSTDISLILNQNSWSGQTNFLRYHAVFNDAVIIVNDLLAKDDPVLLRPKFLAARLLRDSKMGVNGSWRESVIASLVKILQNNDYPTGIRGKAMVALVLSGETNISSLFRQLLLVPSMESQHLIILGAGLMHDTKSIDTIVGLVDDSSEITRQAACLALVEIGTSQALEAVAVYLLRGDERIRVYASEALANHASDGREALREGIHNDDILLRRAVVYGLSRIHEPWATELLEKIQIDDEQWAVRNVAVESLQARQRPDPRIPRKLLAPHETPWLIEFAGKYGIGVTPGQAATDILFLALKDSNRDYFQPALLYLRSSPNESVISRLFPYLYNSEPEIQESIYQTLAFMAQGGATIPAPSKFGIR